MALEPGSTLGPYTVLAFLGAGGMGEVYRARDPKLSREVALKVLPRAFARSPERLKRFEREARLIAALNHPNVATIHDLEEAEGVRFLVLELVDGETLGDRLLRGRLPLEEALRVAQQLAEGLEAAHDKGVIHRDLKPANIKLTADGRVKILDFGLAKALEDPVETDSDEAASRPVDANTTRDGAMMGTPRYMSPEQVGGERLDPRTDVWSFGVVLWELLTAEHPFGGATRTEVLTAILREDPRWERLPEEAPEAVRALLRRCLTRERRERLQAIGEARILLREALRSPGPPPARREGRTGLRTAWVAAATVAAGGLAWLALHGPTPPSAPRLSHPVQISATIGVEDYPTWSPDGGTLAYDSDETGEWDIWVAPAAGGPAANRTAEHDGEARFPSWSPDGQQIAFFTVRGGEAGYYVMPALGGTPRRVIAAPWRSTGGLIWGFYRGPPAWSSDGRQLAGIVYEPNGSDAFIEIADLLTLETRRIALPTSPDSRRDLDWSDDGRFFAFTACPSGDPETSQLWVVPARGGGGWPLSDGRTWEKSPRWGPSARFLDFVSNRGGLSDIWRQPLDGDGHPSGDPMPITNALQIRQARFSPDGSKLVLSRGRWVSNVWRVPLLEDRPATWQDAEQVTFDEAFIEFMDVSPDGERIAFSSDRAGSQDLWTMEVGGGALTRLTADPMGEWCPRWSRDGRRIAFYSQRGGSRQIWQMPADGGAATRVTHNDGATEVTPTWSPDGRELAYWSDRTGTIHIWASSAEGGGDRQITDGPADDYSPSWSPDGRWIAFVSNRGGVMRVWRVSAEGGEPERLSQRTGSPPIWSRDGRRVFFATAGEGASDAGDVWMVSADGGAERPATALRGRRGRLNGATATDGRFLYFTWRTDLSDVWVMNAEGG